MTIKDRKDREREEMRELILNAARDIITSEGVESISIRKLANKIEYSPAIIYHYFKDKDEIVNTIMRLGYNRVLQGLNSIPDNEESAHERLKKMTRKIIELALETPDEYKNIQLNSTPEVLAHTASLYKGAAKEKKALGVLFKSLKEIHKNMDDECLELTAQIVWASIYGLIIKLIIEKDISMEQRNKLIDHLIRCIIDTMILGKPLSNQ